MPVLYKPAPQSDKESSTYYGIDLESSANKYMPDYSIRDEEKRYEIQTLLKRLLPLLSWVQEPCPEIYFDTPELEERFLTTLFVIAQVARIGKYDEILDEPFVELLEAIVHQQIKTTEDSVICGKIDQYVLFLSIKVATRLGMMELDQKGQDDMVKRYRELAEIDRKVSVSDDVSLMRAGLEIANDLRKRVGALIAGIKGRSK